MPRLDRSAVEADEILADAKWAYKCPECGGHKVQVVVELLATMNQTEDGEYTTALDFNDLEYNWSDESSMLCRDCAHCDSARAFDTDRHRSAGAGRAR